MKNVTNTTSKLSKSGFPGETKSPRQATVDKFAKQIQSANQGSVKAILKLAETCHQADQTLDGNSRKHLLEKVGYTAGNFSKYVKIGECNHWSISGACEKLPPRYTLLYELTLLSHELFIEALKGCKIYPNMSRQEIRQLRGENTSRQKMDRVYDIPFDDAVEMGLILRSNKMTETQLDELTAELEKVVERFDVAVLPHSAKAKRAEARQQSTREKILRKVVIGKLVDDLKGLTSDELKERAKSLGLSDTELHDLVSDAASTAKQKAKATASTEVTILPSKLKAA